MFKQFLIILMLLMTVSVFAGKKRVTSVTGYDDGLDKSRACSNAKSKCDDHIRDNETLVGISSCTCSEKEPWSCDVTCTYEKDDE